MISLTLTCILQEDRDSPLTEQAKATGQGIHLGNGKMVLCPQSKEEEDTRHRSWLWGAMADSRGETSTALLISIEKAIGKTGPKLWHLGA